MSTYGVVQFSYRLALIPDELQGRVNSVFRLIIFGGDPIGLALTGILLQAIGTVPAVLIYAGGLIVLAAATTLALTAQAGLKVGDPAPKLQTGKWVQGEPVKEFQSGKAYIVEFWATWCGPCRASIPHLNEIANKYKDKGLIVIGQNCWEENDETAVAPFIKKMGEKMTYRVALDDKSDSKKGKMSDTWMAAAGRNGIPSAFLVDTKGKIAWIGHPMQLKEQIIEDVLAGKFDAHKAAEAYEKEQGNMAKLRII